MLAIDEWSHTHTRTHTLSHSAVQRTGRPIRVVPMDSVSDDGESSPMYSYYASHRILGISYTVENLLFTMKLQVNKSKSTKKTRLTYLRYDKKRTVVRLV